MLLDSPKGLFGTIFQDRRTIPSLADINAKSELLVNSLKPYSSCQLTHAPIDAARLLKERIGMKPIESITLYVNPLAIEIAGIQNAASALAIALRLQ